MDRMASVGGARQRLAMRAPARSLAIAPALGAILWASLSFAGPGEVHIVYHFGVEGRNQLDTASRRFKKDQIQAGQLTTKLTLSLAERQRILALAQEVGFFELP